MLHIAVLAGGTSDEREVSLRSGSAVSAALRTAGYQVTELDPAEGLQNLLPKLKRVDAVFPALHGIGGEDGSLQKFLEHHGITYVGPDSGASALCFDKARYAELLRHNDVLVPETLLVNFDGFISSGIRKGPYVLKPNDGGSSIDTFIVRAPEKADESAMETAFEKHGELLLQKLIEGTEVTVAMLGDEPLPVIEIVPPSGGEFDYENKYNGKTRELCPPEHVSEATQAKAQDIAARVHRLTGCRDMSRTDIIISDTEDLYVLETNTIPGLTDASLLPKAARTAGHTMPELCKVLVELALARNT